MKKTVIAVALSALFSGAAIAANLTTPITWDSLAADAQDHTKWDHSNLTEENKLQVPSAGLAILNNVTEYSGSMYLGGIDVPKDQWTSGGETIYGIYNQTGHDLTLTEDAVLYVRGSAENKESSVVGIGPVWDNAVTVTNKGQIWVDGNGGVQVSAIGTNPRGHIVNEGLIKVRNGAYGMIVWSGGADYNKAVKVENSGRIEVDGKDSFGIRADFDANSELEGFEGADHNIIVNTGSIISTNGATAISALGAGTDVRLEGKSEVVGAVKLGEQTDLTVALENENNNSTQLELVGEKIRNVTLTDSTVEFTGEQSKYEFESLTSTAGSQINLVGNNRTLKVNNLVGEASFYSDHVGDGKTPVVDVNGVGSQDKVTMVLGGNIADQVSDNTDVAETFNSTIKVTNESGKDGAYTGRIQETATTGEIIYNRDENGNVTTTFKTSTVEDSTKELAALNALSWRSELSTLTDRMGSIRTQPQNVGAWVRYAGEELEKDDVTATLKMNTVELGVDMPIGQSDWTVGASFSYGDGDGDFDAGATDNKKYTLGLYATYINDYGCFLDIMGKVGKVQSDFEFATTSGVADTGDVDQMGYIFGIEAGKRFSGQTFFAEPSVGLIYSRLDSDSAKTQNRAVKLDAVDSLIARAGTLFGGQFADGRANLYGKAFVLHDFQGDVEGQARALSQGSQWRSFDQELAGTWGEFGVGGTFDFTESSKFYFDVSKTVGGDVDSNYRVNVGAKYTF